MISTEVGRALEPEKHAAAGFLRCIHSVANEIDQDLFELIRIALNGQRRTLFEEHRHARFEAGHTAQEAH